MHDWSKVILERLAPVQLSPARESEVVEELRQHLEDRFRELVAQGLTEDRAYRKVLGEFSGLSAESLRSGLRSKREGTDYEPAEKGHAEKKIFCGISQDIRYGLRQLRRNPRFTAVAVLTLALGIGANTAIFSVVNAVLLRPIAYPDADRLIWLSDFAVGWGDNMVEPAGYVQWRDAATSFETMVAYCNQDLALMVGNDASQERIASITNNFWSVSGARPALGRLFGPTEPDTIVLSYDLFKRKFAEDPKVIGRTVILNGHQFTVTGVLPANFQFLFPQLEYSGDERRDIGAFIPIPQAVWSFWSMHISDLEALSRAVGPVPHAVYVVGKLKPNVPIERARVEMETIFARVKKEHYPPWVNDVILHFAPLKEKIVGNVRPALLVLLGAVGFVLMIAGANIANLLLARASSRQRETAIRVALGAGRARLIRQFLVESALLGLLGGAAGLIFARWALAIFIRLGSQIVPRIGQATLDEPVLLFTLVVSLVAGFLFGLAPSLVSWRSSLNVALMYEGREFSLRGVRPRLRGLLAVAELALAIVLLTGAGLMLKSFWRMNTYPPGFDPDRILVMRVELYGKQFDAWLQQDAYIRELLRRIESVRGVEVAGVQRATLNTTVKVEGGRLTKSGDKPFAAVEAVSPGYLRAMGVPLLKGEWPRDESFDTFVVNETFVRQALDGKDPIGRHLSGAIMNGTIVGEVADFKTWQLDAGPSPEVYVPYQLPPMGRSVRFVVRTSVDPHTLAPVIRGLCTEVDRTHPPAEFRTLAETLADSIAPRRFNLMLLSALASIALGMAMVGVYGVMACLVSQATREIGIRMALGATRRDVLRLFVGRGISFALSGTVAGLAGAFGLTQFMASLLYGVKAFDPATFVVVAFMLVGMTTLAIYVPARRAMKVDPIVALRYE